MPNRPNQGEGHCQHDDTLQGLRTYSSFKVYESSARKARRRWAFPGDWSFFLPEDANRLGLETRT